MAFFIPEVILSLGEAVSTGVAEITGSQALAGAASAFAISQASSEANKAASSAAQTTIDGIFGPGTYNNLKTEVTQDVKEASSTYNVLGTFDDPYTGLRIKKTQGPNVIPKPGPIPTQNAIPTATQNVDSQHDIINKQKINTNSNQVTQPPSVPSVPSETKQTYPPRKTGSDLGQLLSLSASGLIKSSDRKDPWKNISDQMTNYPSLAYLVPKLVDYSSFITQPDTQAYRQIYSIYDGKGLSPQSVRMAINPQGLKVFSAVDETGKLYEWTEKKEGLKVPTINGNWTGPYSINNALPTNLLDTYSFFHDIDYRDNGFFDLEGDYKLISRIVHNFQNMSASERVLAKGTIDYFSTVGHSLASYKKTLPSNVADTVVDAPIQDDISTTFGVQNKEDRFEFYNGLKNAFEEETNRSSVLATTGSAIIERQLLSLNIQLA